MKARTKINKMIGATLGSLIIFLKPKANIINIGIMISRPILDL
jgi:hypothetical protein